MQQDLHDQQSIKPRSHVINYDARSLRKLLKEPHRGRLHDIESPEKYKAQQQRFP